MRPRTPTKTMLAGLLAALQVTLGLPLGALAQAPPPRVYIAPIQGDAAPGAAMMAKALDDGTRTQLRTRSAVQMTDQGNLGPVRAGEADPRVAEAERLRVAGKADFAAGKHQPALDQLRAALKLYEEGLASVPKMEAVLETLGFLGAVSLALGYDADARDFFRQVVAMAPDAEPLDEYGDDAKALFEKERKKLLRKKRGTLKVITDPPGGVIRLDGEAAGVAPLKLDDLVRGPHYIQVEHPEAGLAARKVRVKGGKSVEVTLKPAAEVGPAAPVGADPADVAAALALAGDKDLGEAFRARAEAIARKTKADYVVVGHVRPLGARFVLDAFLYGVQQKQVAAFDRAIFRAELSSAALQATQFADAIVAAAQRFPSEQVVVGRVVEPAPVAAPPLTALTTEAEPPPPERGAFVDSGPVSVETPPPPEDEAWYQQWWVWTLAGVVVIGGTATGGYFLLQDEGHSGSFDAKVSWR